MSRPLKTGVGVAQGLDAAAAASDAACRAIAANPHAKLAIVFAGFALDQRAVAAGAADGLDGLPFVGGSAFAEISTTGFSSQSVVVMTLSGEFEFASAAARLGDDAEATAESLTADALARLGGTPHVALLFCSSESGAGNQVVRGVNRALAGHETLVFGGACGSLNEGPGRIAPSFQYRDGHAVEQGAAILLLTFQSPTVRVATSSGHGLQPISLPLTCSRADAQWVYEVEGENVIEFYEKYMAKRVEEVGAYIFTYPFLMQHGQTEGTAAQVPLMIDREARRIAFFPRAPQEGETITLAHATREQLLRACREAAYRTKVALGGARPALAIIVSCVARQMILGTRTQEEAQILFEVFGKDVPVIGLYSAMEIAPMEGQRVAEAVAETFCLLVVGDAAEARPVSRPPVDCLPANSTDVREDYHRALTEINDLRRQIQESDALLDFREQVLMKTIRDNIDMTSELKIANLNLSELNRKNGAILKMIRQYTPHTTFQKAGRQVDEGNLSIPDEQAELTYLFLDVKGFTRFSETHSPEEVIQSLNAILRPAVDTIIGMGGDVNKFIGDALFATFTDSAKAVKAALSVAGRVALESTEFQVRIGINRGRSVLGNVGSEQRKDNTLIGDAVNLAQRLEANCTPGRVLISKAVLETVPELNLKGEHRTIQVKGKSEAIDVFEVSPEYSTSEDWDI